MNRHLTGLAAVAVCALGVFAFAEAAPQIQRRIEQSFKVSPTTAVVVRVNGGPILVETGPAGTVRVQIDQKVDVSADARADEILKDYEVSATEQAGVITVLARRLQNGERGRRGEPGVRFDTTLTVPASSRLELDTSGGPITVRGERTADVIADTSGGPIDVDGGRATLDLDTSGGPIRVGRALGTLLADTSGGHITVDYVGPSSSDVQLDTSGGHIRVSVDRRGKFDFHAATSGGHVSVDGLSLETESLRRNRVTGRVNGGGGRFSAQSSGGHVEIRGVDAP